MQHSEFSALYRSSYPYIRSLVSSVSRDRQSAEDTVQEVYLAAWTRLRDTPHPNPYGWLVITARHKACDALRRRLREDRICVKTGCDPDRFAVLPPLPAAEAPYRHIRPLLSPKEFDLVLSHYLRGDSVEELAGRLHISRGACYMRLARARRKLAVLIDDPPRKLSS